MSGDETTLGSPEAEASAGQRCSGRFASDRDRELLLAGSGEPPLCFASVHEDLCFRASLAVAELLRLVPETRADLVALHHELTKAAQR